MVFLASARVTFPVLGRPRFIFTANAKLPFPLVLPMRPPVPRNSDQPPDYLFICRRAYYATHLRGEKIRIDSGFRRFRDNGTKCVGRGEFPARSLMIDTRTIVLNPLHNPATLTRHQETSLTLSHTSTFLNCQKKKGKRIEKQFAACKEVF